MIQTNVPTQNVPLTLLDEHPDNVKLVPPLTAEETQLLKDRLQHHYEAHPFVVLADPTTGRYLVLDGNTRLRLLRELGQEQPVPVIVKGTITDLDWQIEAQHTYIENCSLGRRNLTSEQKVWIARQRAARGVPLPQISRDLNVSERWAAEQTQDVREIRKEVQKFGAIELRHSGLSQAEVAPIVEVDRSTVAKWESVNSSNNAEIPARTPDADSSQAASAMVEQVKRCLQSDAILAQAEQRRAKSAKTAAITNKPATMTLKLTPDNVEGLAQQLVARLDGTVVNALIAELQRLLATAPTPIATTTATIAAELAVVPTTEAAPVPTTKLIVGPFIVEMPL